MRIQMPMFSGSRRVAILQKVNHAVSFLFYRVQKEPGGSLLNWEVMCLAL